VVLEILNEPSICAEAIRAKEVCAVHNRQDGDSISGAQAIASLSKYRKEIAELTVSMQEVRGCHGGSALYVHRNSTRNES
jgi:hypothetical protein